MLLTPILVLAGCGSGDGGADRKPTTTRAPGPATDLPAGYRGGRLVATAHHVVRLSGDLDDAGPPSERFRRLDLRTGEEGPLDPPPTAPAGRELVLLQQVVGLDDAVLQAGLICDAPYLDEAGDGDCRDGRLAFHRIDPVDGTWTLVPLPVELEEVAHATSLLQALPDGGAVAVVAIRTGSVPAGASRTLVLDGDRWRLSGGPDQFRSRHLCATATELIVPSEVPDPQPDDQPGTATIALDVRARSLATGEWRDLPRPPIDGSYGGAGVEVACSTERVAVASKGPGLDGPGSVHVLDGDRWVSADGLLDPAVRRAPTTGWSGGPVAVLGLAQMGRANLDSRPGEVAVVRGDGTIELVGADGSLADRELVALGPTGRFLVLGPSQSPTELDETPDAGRPIPIRTLDLTS